MFGRKKVQLTAEEYQQFLGGQVRLEVLEKENKGLRELLEDLRRKFNERFPTQDGYADFFLERAEAELNLPQFTEEVRQKLSQRIQGRLEEFLKTQLDEDALEKLVEDALENMDYERLAEALARVLKDKVNIPDLVEEIAKVISDDLDLNDVVNDLVEALAERTRITISKS